MLDFDLTEEQRLLEQSVREWAAREVHADEFVQKINGGYESVVRERGASLRFLLKRRDMAKVVIETSFNIEAWPKTSCLFIAHIDKKSGVYREADPIALGDYMEGFDLVSGIRLEDAANLKEVRQRPVVSGVVRRRG